VLFTIGVVALVKMSVISVRGTGFNKEVTTATSLAQASMEDIRGSLYSAVASNATGVQNVLSGITYTTTWSVTESGSSPARHKNVTVTVTWGAKNITLVTIISEL
jgi:hypothetical protein